MELPEKIHFDIKKKDLIIEEQEKRLANTNKLNKNLIQLIKAHGLQYELNQL